MNKQTNEQQKKDSKDNNIIKDEHSETEINTLDKLEDIPEKE